MAIPDFQSVFLPLLKFCADGQEHTNHEALDAIAKHFAISEAERAEMLPSGRQTIIANRMGWARTFLTKAGLLESTRRTFFRITERGKSVLAENPEKLNTKYLMRYKEFVQFQSTSSRHAPSSPASRTEEEIETPLERLERAYQGIRHDLASDLLERARNVPPEFFERLVVEVLVAMGYGGNIRDAGKAIGRSGDGGIDGIIKEDRLGLDVIYVQAKRWEGCVGRPEIQKFVGALSGQRAKKGVFITTGRFSEEAHQYAQQIDVKLVLIDGEQLSQYMIDFGVGTAVQQVFEVRKVDEDYFEQE